MTKTLTTNDVICKLMEVADDHDASTVESLAIKAGFYWACAHCNGYCNVVDDERCGSCGTPRAEAEGEDD